ncbi:hypothetical protein ACHAO7_011849 [Fusarium culmorum]
MTDNTDESLLESAFEVVQKKQNERKELLKKLHDANDKCNSMSDKIESLEAQLKASDSQYKQEKVKYDNAKAELDEFHLLRSYGDWFAILIKRIIILEPYENLNKAKSDQAKEEKKAEMAAKGEKFKGDFTYEKVDSSYLATIETNWSAMHKRENTETDKHVEAEKEKIAAWRAGGGGEEDAPATPFLDRIQILCDIYGIERQRLLPWIKEYAKRNSICHLQPPVVADHWMVTQNSEGKTVHVVLEEEHAEEGIKWWTFWDAFHSCRQDIESRHTAGQIDIERRNLYIEMINEYYALYSEANDEAGNPILTKYAKDKAKEKCQIVNEKLTEPPENAEKNYKEGKWDDL